VAQGLTITSAWYWDKDDPSRAFAKRFMARNANGPPPTYVQAGIYTEVAFYLKAIQAAGTDDADKVVAQMRNMKINDFMTNNGWLREDGRVMRDMYLEQVKSLAESKYAFDYVKILATIPAEEAFRPLKEGGCPLVHG
jgi:branched-chain amino acid transport system substrate-binding protein